MIKVAAIFATMNRHAVAVSCVHALRAQTHIPELVIVADNNSEDGTAEILDGLDDLPFGFELIRMGYNGGNAGGVAAAMEFAFAGGVDAVWILDDDSIPRPEALAALLVDWSPKVVSHPLQIDPSTEKLTWPEYLVQADGRKKVAATLDELGNGDYFPTNGSWTGALISREIFETVGPVNADLFIRGEDEEYPWRISQHGYSFRLCRQAVLDHPGPAVLLKWSLFGKSLYLEPGLSDWKLYYKVRNMVWLKAQQSGLLGALAMAGAYTLGILKVDGIRRFSLLLKACSDGLHGKLGKM